MRWWMIGIAVLIAAAPGTQAEAQLIGNAPISLGASAFGSAFAPSVASRQAILGAELDGSRPRNLVRSGNGFLLDVERGRAGQAFLRVPAQPFVVPATVAPGFGGIGVSFAVGGFGLGVAGGQARVPLYPYGATLAHVAYGPSGPAGTPIDAWVAILESP